MAAVDPDPRAGDWQTTLSFRGHERVLSPAACAFLVDLHERFAPRVEELLAERRRRQEILDAGELPDFPLATRDIREADWRIGPVPVDLRDRRVEITGPVDRKMVINALNSGARVFMADFEDAHAPTWEGTLAGQLNLMEAVRGTIAYDAGDGRHYRLGEHTATLVVRPRGWHLPEKHFRVMAQPIPAALFDFGLYLHHNARRLLDRGTGPYFYLPKLEGRREAELWGEVFAFSEDRLGLPRGTIKATVLIETLPAAFEMDEILYALRDYAVGLNCGRWDYIFSYIKRLRAHPERVLPDRDQVTMTCGFLRSYSRLLIRVCHRRGAHAMGGMAAQIPVRGDPQANERALAKVRADKEREVSDGHDGTWVAHPGLVAEAMEVFDAGMPGPSQLHRSPSGPGPTAADLLQPAAGTITEAGVRGNLAVALQYLAAWLGGRGAVPIHHLMEDAATAEIARSQLWQWVRHGGVLDGGGRLSEGVFLRILQEERDRLLGAAAADPALQERCAWAAGLVQNAVLDEELAEFLTLPAYELLA